MKKVIKDSLRAGLVIGDAICFFAGFMAAYYLRFNTNIIPMMHDVPNILFYLYAAPVVVIAGLLSLNYAGLYRFERVHGSRLDELFSVIIAVSASVIFMLAFSFFVRQFSYSRVVMVYTWILCVLLISLFRLSYRLVYFGLSRKGMVTQNIIIAGATEVSANLIERIARAPQLGYRIIGVMDDKLKKGKRFSGIPVLGRVKALTSEIRKNGADEVFIGMNNYDRRQLAGIILENERTKFMIASDVLGIITKSIDYDELCGIPIFAVRELPLEKMLNRVIKRTFDIVFSATALIVLSPLLVCVAMLVKATSRGPVFYKQERVGRNGKTFLVYKFRTMKHDAEKKTGPVWAKKGDDRTTKVGAVLRKTSIDELPQFINIFLGQMSVVGPRPERPHFVEKFKDEIPRYMERHKVKSGLTGWAAVNGLRGNTSLTERVKYDLYYIENWSLWFDMKIIIKTALEVFHHSSAY